MWNVLQFAAQVLDEFEDEDIGVGLIDAKHDKAVAKKLGKRSRKLIHSLLWKRHAITVKSL